MALELRTERLRLTCLRPEDAPAMYAYRSHPDVRRHQTFEPSCLADVEAWIREQEERVFDTPGTWCQLAVRALASDALIGDVGLGFGAHEARQVEIGFTIAPDQQHRGYGTEAVSGILDHLLVDLGKHRVTASVDPRNKASMALLRRVGMRQEAHFRESLWWKGAWVDDVVFAILKSEWLAEPGGRG